MSRFLCLAHLGHASWQFKCSYQKGSLFLSFMVTVFLAPSRASNQVLEPYDEDGLMLVEVQLREGDGLYFSGLYQDLVDIVNVRTRKERSDVCFVTLSWSSIVIFCVSCFCIFVPSCFTTCARRCLFVGRSYWLLYRYCRGVLFLFRLSLIHI